MAPTTRLMTGTTLALALLLLAGTALLAGAAFAQETTEDGMGGNETMDDGTETMMDGNGSMDDSTSTENESMTEEGMDGASMTEEETMDDGSMTDDESMDDESTTEDSMDDESMTEEDMAEEQMTEEMTDETASGGQPGFGVVVGLAALIAAAGFAVYRRRA